MNVKWMHIVMVVDGWVVGRLPLVIRMVLTRVGSCRRVMMCVCLSLLTHLGELIMVTL